MSSKNKTHGVQSLKRLHADQCGLIHKNFESESPLQYLQYQYRPYPSKPYAGFKQPNQTMWNGYDTPACSIDTESFLKQDGSNILTNQNVHQELPMLPVQVPYVRGCRDINDESELKISHFDPNFKSCTADTEDSFIPHRFQYFNQLCYNPQTIVNIDEVQNFQKFDPNYLRGGVSSRTTSQHRQRSCARNPNIYDMIAPVTNSIPYASVN